VAAVSSFSLVLPHEAFQVASLKSKAGEKIKDAGVLGNLGGKTRQAESRAGHVKVEGAGSSKEAGEQRSISFRFFSFGAQDKNPKAIVKNEDDAIELVNQMKSETIKGANHGRSLPPKKFPK